MMEISSFSRPRSGREPTSAREEEARGARRARPGLVEAVAAIVAIAAEQARLTGDIVPLRKAVEAALGSPEVGRGTSA
jgi:hypothetical protein